MKNIINVIKVNNNYVNYQGQIVEKLGDAEIFYYKQDAKDFIKEKKLKDTQIIPIGDLKVVARKEIDEYAKKLKRDDRRVITLNYINDFTSGYYQRARDEYLREIIHEKQFYTSADKAGVLILQENNKNEILISNANGSDGTCKIAILDKDDDIPSYYKGASISLNGKYKIMSSDCTRNYEGNGTEIDGKYDIYRAGMSFIFKKI